MKEAEFRYAEEKDVELILYFIKELAEYEKMLDEVIATEDLLREWLFEKKKAEETENENGEEANTEVNTNEATEETTQTPELDDTVIVQGYMPLDTQVEITKIDLSTLSEIYLPSDCSS